MADSYGGGWTLIKLDKVERYLQAYATAMKKTPFVTRYIDAFAGTGYFEPGQTQTPGPSLLDMLEETPDSPQQRIDGSAVRSLKVTPSFARYQFIEMNRSNAERLQELKSAFPSLADRIEIIPGESNRELRRICEEWPVKDRGVIFLDPFGMEVEWSTLEAIARTRCLDVWYLVTTGLVRMLPRAGVPSDKLRDKLRRTYGQDGIDDIFYPRETKQTLYEDEPVEDIERRVDWNRVRDFFLARLRSIFQEGVAPNPRWLYDNRGRRLFLLCFAVGSASPSAQSLALRIANYILEMD